MSNVGSGRIDDSLYIDGLPIRRKGVARYLDLLPRFWSLLESLVAGQPGRQYDVATANHVAERYSFGATFLYSDVIAWRMTLTRASTWFDAPEVLARE